MNRAILYAAILSVACPVHAMDKEIVRHAASYHMGVEGYNQINPGLGLRIIDTKTVYSAGFYDNSLGTTSLYAGAGRQLWHIGRYTLNIQLGLATGYGIPAVPFVLPELVINLGDSRVIIEYFPKVKVGDFQTHQGLGFSVAVPF